MNQIMKAILVAVVSEVAKIIINEIKKKNNP